MDALTKLLKKVIFDCNVGFLKHKTIILNDDKQNYPFYRLKLLVEKFGHNLFGISQ